MKYYIIAGEASGDLHGSNLIKALKAKDPAAQVRAWGGDRMQAAGATLAKHYKDLAFMGIIQVLKNLRTILGNFRFCHADIQAFQPDVLILIDYSGFNLRVAKWAKQEGYRVVYYISPQIWATRAKRVFKIKQYVDKMLVILPFEKAFYEKYDYSVNFVGHPLLDIVAQNPMLSDFHAENQLSDQPIIALLPGSRKQEIRAMLQLMLTVTNDFPEHQFVIGAAPSIPLEFYQPFLENSPNVRLVQNQTYALLQHSQAALVTSGTATLETALFQVPQVVCYRASALLYWIVKRIIKVKYISLVNLIMDKEVVKELIQNELNAQNIKIELSKLFDPEHRQKVFQDYQELKQKLGNKGASMRAAEQITTYLDDSNNSNDSKKLLT